MRWRGGSFKQKTVNGQCSNGREVEEQEEEEEEEAKCRDDRARPSTAG